MEPSHALTFDLLQAFLEEDSETLDRVDSLIFGDLEMSRAVFATTASLLLRALVNVHGEAGALAHLDQARAAYAAMTS